MNLFTNQQIISTGGKKTCGVQLFVLCATFGMSYIFLYQGATVEWEPEEV